MWHREARWEEEEEEEEEEKEEEEGEGDILYKGNVSCASAVVTWRWRWWWWLRLLVYYSKVCDMLQFILLILHYAMTLSLSFSLFLSLFHVRRNLFLSKVHP